MYFMRDSALFYFNFGNKMITFARNSFLEILRHWLPEWETPGDVTCIQARRWACAVASSALQYLGEDSEVDTNSATYFLTQAQGYTLSFLILRIFHGHEMGLLFAKLFSWFSNEGKSYASNRFLHELRMGFVVSFIFIFNFIPRIFDISCQRSF